MEAVLTAGFLPHLRPGPSPVSEPSTLRGHDPSRSELHHWAVVTDGQCVLPEVQERLILHTTYLCGGIPVGIDVSTTQQPGKRPIVLAVHGSGGLYSGYLQFPQMLADRGFSVFLPHFFDTTPALFGLAFGIIRRMKLLPNLLKGNDGTGRLMQCLLCLRLPPTLSRTLP